jgi:hypothetical protein
MNKRRLISKATIIFALGVALTASSAHLRADTGNCSGQMISLPFTDVPNVNPFFCSIAEAFFSGLTNGTDASHYSPSANVPREQMAALVTRAMDQSVTRGSRRAALQQFWTIQGTSNLGLTTVGTTPLLVQSDGLDLWVANSGSNSVSRVRASSGNLLNTWTSATGANGVLCAMGKVFITGTQIPGRLYEIDPAEPAGAVTTVTSSLGDNPGSITFDGTRIWTANESSVSIISLSPLNVVTVTTSLMEPRGIIYDGSSIWVTDQGDATIKKLDSNGSVAFSLILGGAPERPAFDGTNLWIPENLASSVAVVRAVGPLANTVLTELTGNGLNRPKQAAFDGERILITNLFGNSVSLFRSSDLSPIGSLSTGANSAPYGAGSDGVNFWITLSGSGKLARF